MADYCTAMLNDSDERQVLEYTMFKPLFTMHAKY